MAIDDVNPVGEAAIGLEEIGVAFIAAQAEAGGDVERHLVAAMGDQARGRPAGLVDDIERAQIFNKAIGKRAVKLKPVAVRAHAAMTQQIARILMREEVFPRCHRSGIEFADCRL